MRRRRGRAASAWAAVGAVRSGKKALEMKPTSVPTATPTARVRASMPTNACSMTPATGIIAKAITSTMASGLPLTSPAKKDHEKYDCRQQDAGDGVVLQQRHHYRQRDHQQGLGSDDDPLDQRQRRPRLAEHDHGHHADHVGKGQRHAVGDQRGEAETESQSQVALSPECMFGTQ